MSAPTSTEAREYLFADAQLAAAAQCAVSAYVHRVPAAGADDHKRNHSRFLYKERLFDARRRGDWGPVQPTRHQVSNGVTDEDALAIGAAIDAAIGDHIEKLRVGVTAVGAALAGMSKVETDGGDAKEYALASLLGLSP